MSHDTTIHAHPTARVVGDVPALTYLDTIDDDDIPAAGVDPIESLAEALAAVGLFIHRPLRHETIVLWRDHLDRGQGMVSVNGTEHPSDVLDVLEAMADALDGPLECGCDPFPEGPDHVGSLIIVSIRPGTHADSADIALWSDLSALASSRGVTLTEWVVIGNDIRVPRVLAGQPSRW
ncbi:MAG: hypothetical protein RIR49_774 [Actinomycetota bacterium]|jgi:hypothetical protein